MSDDNDLHCDVCGRPGERWTPFERALCDRHARDAFEETGWGDDGLYLAQVYGPWVAGPEHSDQGPQPGGAHLLTSPASADVHVGLTIPCLAQTGDIVMVRYVWVERQQDPYDVQGHTAHLYYRAVPVGPLPPAVAAIYQPRGRAGSPGPEIEDADWVKYRAAVDEMIAEAGGISEDDHAWARNAFGVRPPTGRTITSEDVADAEEQMDVEEPTLRSRASDDEVRRLAEEAVQRYKPVLDRLSEGPDGGAAEPGSREPRDLGEDDHR